MLQYCDDGRIAVSRIGPYGSLDHYLAQSGKRIGHNSTIGTPGSLRRTYGFNSSEVTTTDYPSYVDSGYAIANLMVAVAYEYRWNTLTVCSTATEFYIDEPITHQTWSFQAIIEFADSVHKLGKRIGVGEQNVFLIYYSQYFDLQVVPYLDFVTSSSYTGDQRDDWSTFRNRYGSKFDRVWISSTEDDGDYANLLGHANNLGINTVFFYGDGGTQQQLNSFCEYARGSGWLRKFVQEVLQMWCCTTTTWNPGTCELNSTTPTGYIVEY
jgi:hypothetical protein